MSGKTIVLALIGISLVGCGSTRTLQGNPAGWTSALDNSERVTVFESSGREVTIQYETIADGILYGASYDDAATAYSIPLDEIQKLEIEDSRSLGKKAAIFAFVLLVEAVIVARSDPDPFLGEYP